jgi:inorganic pyrophosphatase
MRIAKIPVGVNPPWDIHVVIEIAKDTPGVKLELEKESGAMFVDRILATAMHYPCDYGFVPHTLAEDGDPVDALVVSPQRLDPSWVIRVRPVGVLRMEDEAGPDEKLICVPVDKVSEAYSHIKNYTDLPQELIKRVGHFFGHYKELEANKWVKIAGWDDADTAAEIVKAAMARWSKAVAARRPTSY